MKRIRLEASGGRLTQKGANIGVFMPGDRMRNLVDFGPYYWVVGEEAISSRGGVGQSVRLIQDYITR